MAVSRDYCTAFVNIDLNAVGNWAERNNIAYGGYQELSQHPQVLDMIQAHIEETNQSIAQDPMLSGLPSAPLLGPAQGIGRR